jgi:hypothetical protein
MVCGKRQFLMNATFGDPDGWPHPMLRLHKLRRTQYAWRTDRDRHAVQKAWNRMRLRRS